MRAIRQLTALTIGAVLLSGAACTAAPDTPQPSPSTVDVNVGALREAATALTTTSYSFESTDQWSTVRIGQVDPKSGNGWFTTTASRFSAAVDVVSIGPDRWIRLHGRPKGLGTAYDSLPTDWVRLDPVKLSRRPAGHELFGAWDSMFLGGASDPGYSGTLFQRIRSVRKVESGHYTGAFDLFNDMPNAGTAADRAPFEATLDERGRLTMLSWQLDLPEGSPSGGRVRTTYGGFGQPIDLAAPPAIAAPDLYYDYLRYISH